MEKNASHYRYLAVFSALLAGAAWGVSFLAPRALDSADPVTLALFRFLFFGISSAIALAFTRLTAARKMPKPSGADCLRALVLGAAGYSIYYFLLAAGVKGAGVSFSVGIIGLLPLTILAVSTPPKRWAGLAWSALLILSGVGMIAWDLFSLEEFSLAPETRLRGSIACFGALLLWTYFAVANAKFLRSNPAWRALDWAGVVGVASAIISSALFLGTEGSGAGERFLHGVRDPRLLLWTAFMGVVGAWGATALWNFASRHLPGSWLGPLLVFESIFGLWFGFLYDRRGPRPLEGIALVALLGGVVLGLLALSREDIRHEEK